MFFLRNSNLTEHPVLLYAKSGNPTSEPPSSSPLIPHPQILCTENWSEVRGHPIQPGGNGSLGNLHREDGTKLGQEEYALYKRKMKGEERTVPGKGNGMSNSTEA